MGNFKNNILENTTDLFIEDVLDYIKIGIVVLNADYSITKMSVGFMNMFGYKQDDLLSRSINILFNSNEFNVLQEYMKNANHSNHVSSVQKYELNGFRQDKTIITLEITIFHSIEDRDYMYMLIMRDISEFKQTVEDLKYLAYYDQLTKLPNRILFRDRVDTAIRIARREEEQFAIVYIDIDDFKVINDTMGHDAGDILLKELSQRFQKCVRDSDTVARAGGDEFTILMLKISCLEDVSIVAERILESNLLPVRINDQDIVPKTSLGISIFPQDGDKIDILLINADTAMYSAKENGNNQFMFYNPIMMKGAN